MKSFYSSIKLKLFLIIFTFIIIFSRSSFAADNIIVPSSTTTCDTSLCTTTAAETHILWYPNTTSSTLRHSFYCPTAGDACKNVCIAECLKFIQWIKSPGIADASASASSNSFTRSMCNALKVVTGSAGKTFAAFAIIAVGIGFFSGKVSWGLMIGVAAGIAAMFGAPSIVAAISGQDTNMMCSIN